jgi:hypothetical protein
METLFIPPTIPARGRPPTAAQEAAKKAAKDWKQQPTFVQFCKRQGVSPYLTRYYISKV